MRRRRRRDVDPPPGQATPAAAAAAPAPPPGKALAAQRHIEEIVRCPAPEAKTACDPSAPVCEKTASKQAQHCLQTTAGWFCGVCPERDRIRHVFKPRDFAGEELHDPFQSPTLAQAIGATTDRAPVRDPTQQCRKFVAANYGYQNLRLVGIVSEGTKRKVLMMDAGNFGHIIQRNDCVGKEKAIVKDIGAGYVTFEVTPDPTGQSGRPPEEFSVQLAPTRIAITSPGDEEQAAGTGSKSPTVTPNAPAPKAPGAPVRP